ncbi:MAG: transglutaminase domain-containing protein [Bacteroidota bacterium]
MNFKKHIYTYIFFLLCIVHVHAQDISDIQKRYNTENAVMTDYSEHVVLQYVDGQLTAKSYISEEILLLTELSPGIYNSQNVYHSYFSQLGDLEGISLIPNSKGGYKTLKASGYKTTSSQRESVFYDDAKQTAVSFSGLVKNARTRVAYTIDHKDLHFLPQFFFQNYLPIVKASFEITAPKTVHLKFVLKGNDTSKIVFSTKEKRNEITYSWIATDMPKIVSYNDAPSFSYYSTCVIPYITGYTAPHQDSMTHMLANTDDLYRFYFNFIKNVNQNNDEVLDNTLAEIIKGDTEPRQKAKHIYEWVQKNMHYVAFEDSLGGFIPREAADICKRKFGDCKDMSSIQVALYRKAGIPAYFTWIGTRDKPYTYEETPLPINNNHMICTILLDGQWIFLDGTDPLIPFGIPPFVLQGKEALVGINEHEYEILKVPEIAAEKNTVSDSTLIQLSDKDLVGSAGIRYNGYGAWGIEALMMYRNENEREAVLKGLTKRGSNKYIQNNFDYRISNDDEKDVYLSSQFVLKDYVQSIGKEFYVNMNLLHNYEEDWVDVAERKVAIEHNYKNKVKQIVVLDIPTGYHVTYLPPNKEQSVSGLWNYKLSYSSSKSEVKLEKEYELQTLYITPSQFAEHNKMVDELKKQYKESIVLSSNQ